MSEQLLSPNAHASNGYPADGHRKNVYLHQFVQFFGSEAWIPISIGLIAAHARANERFDRHYEIKDFIYMRERPEEIVARYENPSILAFSTYIWNVRLSLEVARLAKQRFPEVLTVFGGPSAPAEHGAAEGFLRQHPFVDVIAANEGETTFLEYGLSLLDGSDQSQVAGLHRLVNGAYVASPPRPLTKNMDELASPYVNGTFDPIMGGPVRFHAIWETSRGCPFRCGFCYWGDPSRSTKSQAGRDRLDREMDWFVEHEIELLYIADSNFGWLERDRHTAEGLVRRKREYGYPKKVMLTWAKNANDKCFEVAKILNAAGLCYPITTSYQSLDATALKNIQRSNITLDRSKELREKYRANNMSTYTDLLIGIPGETYPSFVNGIEDTIQYGEHDQIQVYPIRILPNTDMARPAYIAEHRIKTVRTPLQSKHGTLVEDDPVPEMEDIIIETATMPTGDWKRMMEVTWFAQSFFCLKSAYFVLLFLSLHLRQRVMDFAEFFLARLREQTRPALPLLAGEVRRVEAFLSSFLAGDPRVDTSDLELPAVRWPIEEVSFIKLALERDRYHDELRVLVEEFLAAKGVACDPALLDEVFRYQQSRVVNPAGPAEPVLELTHSLPQFFDAAIRLAPIPLAPQPTTLRIIENYRYDTIQDFVKLHVWYGRQGKSFYYQVSYDSTADAPPEFRPGDIHSAIPTIST
ncbi:MAG: cobalamin B12-binding domain-containing protein [Candidatus Rokubacteria bacterium]|nr:cobalamin B12-binding domain-containing protein [Candidatus Rokubacteria bacterium]